MNRLHFAITLLLALPAAAQTPPAAAPAPANAKEDARRLFLAGKQAYQAGSIDVAAQAFEEAYRIAPAPGLLFNLAQAYRKQYGITGDSTLLQRAVEDYRRYLADAPAGPNRALATEALADLAPMLARVAPGRLPSSPAVRVTPTAPAAARTELMIVTETENAQVRLDGQPAAPAPLLATVQPGPHKATVEAEGYFATELRLMAVDGRLVTGEARLSAKPGHIQVSGDAGAIVGLDGREVGRLPLPQLDVSAGRHMITLVERGRTPWVGELQVERDRTTPVRPDLPPTAQRRAIPWLLGLTCASAATAIAAGAVWAQADSAAGNIYNNYTSGQLSIEQLSEYQSDRDRRDAWRTGTYVTIGITAALAVVTATLYFFDRQPAPRIAPRADLPGVSSASAR
jgi:hypothetical protein